MPNTLDPLAAQAHPPERFAVSATDDECLRQLAAVVETHDTDKLAEVAGLIGRLAVPIE
jgi:hypothetical protein